MANDWGVGFPNYDDKFLAWTLDSREVVEIVGQHSPGVYIIAGGELIDQRRFTRRIPLGPWTEFIQAREDDRRDERETQLDALDVGIQSEPCPGWARLAWGEENDNG